jgi:predicted Zn-dependent protease with MMP-like domain/Flp pilus assembly protein TadD
MSGPPDDADSVSDEALATIDAELAAGRTEAALALADSALQRTPSDPDLHHARGVALRLLERPEEALEAMEAALQLDRSLAEAWLDAAEILVEDLDDEVEALELLAQARRHVTEPAALAEVELLRGMALAQLEDYTGALQALEAAAVHDPSHPDVHAERGSVLVELLRVDEAESALQRSLSLSDESARAHELLGFVLDYTGRRDAALRHFRRAGELDPQVPPEPVRVGEDEFDVLVDRALAEIPDPFAARLKNVEISVENYADKDACRRHDCSPTVLGLYVGTPLPERGANDASPPDRIILFQRALENACRDRDELVEEIAVTLKHEIGHLLGFTEDELHERGHG